MRIGIQICTYPDIVFCLDVYKRQAFKRRYKIDDIFDNENVEQEKKNNDNR